MLFDEDVFFSCHALMVDWIMHVNCTIFIRLRVSQSTKVGFLSLSACIYNRMQRCVSDLIFNEKLSSQRLLKIKKVIRNVDSQARTIENKKGNS